MTFPDLLGLTLEALGSQLGAGAFEFFGVASVEHDARALPGKFDRRCPTDAAARTRDEDDFL